jgi:hypothetical protein
MHFELDYLGSGRWRASMQGPSGKMSSAEGDLRRIQRLVCRAEQLYAVWGGDSQRPRTFRSTIPAAPSGLHIKGLRSVRRWAAHAGRLEKAS